MSQIRPPENKAVNPAIRPSFCPMLSTLVRSTMAKVGSRQAMTVAINVVNFNMVDLGYLVTAT